MKRTIYLQIIFFIACTLALLIPFIYAGTVTAIHAWASSPAGGSRPYSTSYGSTHNGTVSLSGSEKGSYYWSHEIRYPNGTLKVGRYMSCVDGLNSSTQSFATSLVDNDSNWTIGTNEPSGNYSHRARTQIVVPGQEKIEIDSKTYTVN